MNQAKQLLQDLNLPDGDRYDLPTSPIRFGDGGHYRIEIPSVEGPAAMAAVLDEAQHRGVRVHRVSQGSGMMLLTDGELREMAALGAQHQVEVSLFVGPRADLGRDRPAAYARRQAVGLAPYRHRFSWRMRSRTWCAGWRRGSAVSWSPTKVCSGS